MNSTAIHLNSIHCQKHEKCMNHETAYIDDLSVLDVHLDLSSQVLVIIVALLKFEVNQETVVIVEAEKIIARCLIAFKLLFEGNGIATVLDVGRTAIDTVSILRRHERLDVDLVLTVLDLLGVVHAATVHALVLILFNVDEDVIRERQVNESVQATAIGLEGLRLSEICGEICKDEPILCLCG